MKTIILIGVVVLVGGLGIYILMHQFSPDATDVVEETTDTIIDENTTASSTATSTDLSAETILGVSSNGNDITAYHYGTGEKEVVFVGGVHGGYSWNTVLVAYELMDYLDKNPTVLPDTVRVTVIPVLNPDGLERVVGTTTRFSADDVSTDESTLIAGRFNGDTVDLNRNFDCDWQSDATWQSRTVSGGTSAFSEPESRAIRDYIEKSEPESVVVWYSSAGGVFASSCHNGVSDETRELTRAYANASGYPAYEEFDFYEITGDMVNWLAKRNIPAISVLLTNHTDIEWDKNKLGVEALLNYYRE